VNRNNDLAQQMPQSYEAGDRTLGLGTKSGRPGTYRLELGLKN